MSTAALTYARRRASMPLAGSHRPLHTVTFGPTQPDVSPKRPCPLVEMMSVSRITVISSDGHVQARMSDHAGIICTAADAQASLADASALNWWRLKVTSSASEIALYHQLTLGESAFLAAVKRATV